MMPTEKPSTKLKFSFFQGKDLSICTRFYKNAICVMVICSLFSCILLEMTGLNMTSYFLNVKNSFVPLVL